MGQKGATGSSLCDVGLWGGGHVIVNFVLMAEDLTDSVDKFLCASAKTLCEVRETG